METPDGERSKGGSSLGRGMIGKAESAAMEEDLRRSEDSVVIINRQAELEDEDQVGRGDGVSVVPVCVRVWSSVTAGG